MAERPDVANWQHWQKKRATAIVNGDPVYLDAQAANPPTLKVLHPRCFPDGDVFYTRKAPSNALRWGLVFRNPAEAVDPPRPSRPEIQPPSANAVWDLLEAAKETPYHGALVFLAFTGCRRGEALGLR